MKLILDTSDLDYIVNSVASKVIEKLQGTKNTDDKEWFDVKSVSKMLGVSEASVRENWISKKKLEVNRTKTGRIRIHRDEIKRFAEETGRTIYWERN